MSARLQIFYRILYWSQCFYRSDNKHISFLYYCKRVIKIYVVLKSPVHQLINIQFYPHPDMQSLSPIILSANLKPPFFYFRNKLIVLLIKKKNPLQAVKYII